MKRAASKSASTAMDDDDDATRDPPPPPPRRRQHAATLSVIRTLTEPCTFPPTLSQLHDALTVPWKLRVTISPSDDVMCHATFDGEPPATGTTACAGMGRYFNFGTSSVSAPWQDVGKCLQQLLMNQVACRHKGEYLILSSQGLELFLATGPNFPESWFSEVVLPHVHNDRVLHSSYYLLRCRHDKRTNKLVFGYHCHAAHPQDDSHTLFPTFHAVHAISLRDANWRLEAMVVATNLARILGCLKDYAVPLIWKNASKLRLIETSDETSDDVKKKLIQKSYVSDHICHVFNATVGNMIDMYRALEKAKVPHTDRLVSVARNDKDHTICKFAPVGRAYLPMNFEELLDALLCVAEALVAMHAVGIMHRDIRWANVFHAMEDGSQRDEPIHFTREWILFDFEFAAMAPQPAFQSHTLTPGNHAPEMVDTGGETPIELHGTAVDIWGLGYLMEHASVDVPESHMYDLEQLQKDCLQHNPTLRPPATKCLERLRSLQARPRSKEFDLKPMKLTDK